jgi:hypothetical protein
MDQESTSTAVVAKPPPPQGNELIASQWSDSSRLAWLLRVGQYLIVEQVGKVVNMHQEPASAAVVVEPRP